MRTTVTIPLTDRELEIAQLIAYGWTITEEQEELGIVRSTINAAIKSMRLKLRAKTRMEVVMKLLALGLIANPYLDHVEQGPHIRGKKARTKCPS